MLVLAGIVLGQPKPKWHNPDAWRKKLRRGLAEKAIVSILGRPAYVHVTGSDIRQGKSVVGSGSTMTAIWYYGEMPKCVPVNGKEANPTKVKLKLKDCTSAIVVCTDSTPRNNTRSRTPRDNTGGRTQRPHRPVYRAANWTEPDWYNLAEPKAPTRPAIKKTHPLRKPKKWEMPRVWKKLMVGMPIAVVARHIGQADYEDRTRGSSDPGVALKVWHYGTVLHCGVLIFRNNRLYRWGEPFWPEVDKSLYGPAESKRIENAP